MENETSKVLTLIKFSEFLYTVSKSEEYLPETLGGFAYFMKREGVPKSLPFSKWKELLDNYTKREVK